MFASLWAETVQDLNRRPDAPDFCICLQLCFLIISDKVFYWLSYVFPIVLYSF